ncbi:MAG TPA: hypothetical protein VGX78_19520, partial [Pirellulales bacterium]|nr:hypothetical protein [Pirellulales bacterium]
MAEQTDKSTAGGPAARGKSPPESDGERRDFLTKLGAILAGGAVVVVPSAAGLVAFCDPLRRKSGEGGFVRVATLDALPDGSPQFFQVIADKQDAWTLYPKEPLGGV